MQYDIWKFFTLLLLAGILGFSLGNTSLVMLLMAIGIIVWQVHQLNALYRWMINPRKNSAPETSGQTYRLHREINRRNIKNKKRKRQLSTLLSQFRKATSAMPDAIVMIDDTGKIEWANSNARKVIGIRWPEDAEVRFSDLIRYPEVDKLLSVRNPPEQGVEVHSLIKKNQTINFKCVRYTEKLRLVVARDVSRLVKVNKMQSDFVANVSHELKTPLTVLRGYMEIIQDSNELPEKFVKPLEQMSLQSARMQFIVNDLLYLAKLEDAENTVAHSPVDVTNMINTIIESVQPLVEEKRHKIEIDIDYELTIVGAQTELHSAFSNLITNAIHYTPDQGLISIRWQANANGAALIVKDNGDGIPAQHLSRLTQRFYRVDADRSRDGGGTGLGLAIVKHVLQRHDAELDIVSTEGSGSEFRCQFPQIRVVKTDIGQVPTQRG